MYAFCFLWKYFAMNTVGEISQALRAHIARRGITQARLRADAGVSQRTLTNVLSGAEDFRLSTLLALADRLGLELLLVPKGAVPALDAGQTSEPLVTSRVAAALQRVRPAPAAPASPRAGRARPRGGRP
jgi:transcriptional regulator with XRE-family HTH domain